MDIRLARAICQGLIEASDGIERIAAWQAIINDGSVWKLAHFCGHSLGREAQHLINKGYCTDTPRKVVSKPVTPERHHVTWLFDNYPDA